MKTIPKGLESLLMIGRLKMTLKWPHTESHQ